NQRMEAVVLNGDIPIDRASGFGNDFEKAQTISLSTQTRIGRHACIRRRKTIAEVQFEEHWPVLLHEIDGSPAQELNGVGRTRIEAIVTTAPRVCVPGGASRLAVHSHDQILKGKSDFFGMIYPADWLPEPYAKPLCFDVTDVFIELRKSFSIRLAAPHKAFPAIVEAQDLRAHGMSPIRKSAKIVDVFPEVSPTVPLRFKRRTSDNAARVERAK